MYRLLSIGPISAYCGVPGIHLGSVTSMSIPAFVRFFDRSFQPHLDQVQHGPIDHPLSH